MLLTHDLFGFMGGRLSPLVRREGEAHDNTGTISVLLSTDRCCTSLKREIDRPG